MYGSHASCLPLSGRWRCPLHGGSLRLAEQAHDPDRLRAEKRENHSPSFLVGLLGLGRHRWWGGVGGAVCPLREPDGGGPQDGIVGAGTRAVSSAR
jgi:hypothetical protein